MTTELHGPVTLSTAWANQLPLVVVIHLHQPPLRVAGSLPPRLSIPLTEHSRQRADLHCSPPLPSLLTLKAPFISPPTKQMDSGESSGSCAATGSASSRRSTGRIAGASLRRSSRGGPSRRACSAPGRLPGAHVTFFSLQIRLSRACCEW